MYAAEKIYAEVHLCEEIISSWRADWERIVFWSIKSPMIHRRLTGSNHVVVFITTWLWEDSVNDQAEGLKQQLGKTVSYRVLLNQMACFYTTLWSWRERFLNWDCANEWRTAVGTTISFAVPAEKVPAHCLSRVAQERTLYLPCSPWHQFPSRVESRISD